MLIALMYPGAFSVTRAGVPTESRVCSACVRLDSANRAALIKGDTVAHADFSVLRPALRPSGPGQSRVMVTVVGPEAAVRP